VKPEAVAARRGFTWDAVAYLANRRDPVFKLVVTIADVFEWVLQQANEGVYLLPYVRSATIL
jgi:hypothetical protein